jgi:opacity protein-like surface antigen
MRKFIMLAAAAASLSAAALAPSAAEAGCYRLGVTGYHWYRFCAGPSFIYPHQRVCRHGYCWYR